MPQKMRERWVNKNVRRHSNLFWVRHDIQRNDTQHNDNQHNYTHHNDIQHNNK